MISLFSYVLSSNGQGNVHCFYCITRVAGIPRELTSQKGFSDMKILRLAITLCMLRNFAFLSSADLF